MAFLEIFIDSEEDKLVKLSSSGNISCSFAAGICLLDLVHSVDWLQRFFLAEKEFLPQICQRLIEAETDDYAARNL